MTQAQLSPPTDCRPARIRSRFFRSLIDVIEWPAAIELILTWAAIREHRTVAICNVHSVVTARRDNSLCMAINNADLSTPDGMPIAWLIGRRLGIRQERVNGPDLTVKLCREAAARRIPVAFFGSSDATLERLRERLNEQFPSLRIALMLAPPFRPLSEAENRDYAQRISESGAAIVFVGLGCPKQERWMAERKAELPGVTIGVGAAFDYIAGTVRRPPLWMQRTGLEWLGRLLAEPRRLWRRYLVTNTLFLVYLIPELLGLVRRDETQTGPDWH